MILVKRSFHFVKRSFHFIKRSFDFVKWSFDFVKWSFDFVKWSFHFSKVIRNDMFLSHRTKLVGFRLRKMLKYFFTVQEKP
ncbi:MAG: hypothetical protein LBQ77_02055 [Treponema sp.]|nr:hypothetical protein [Treponema sp.]